MINILVVDDDPGKTLRISSAFADAFLASEFRVATAVNAYGASQLLMSDVFDLMVVDLSIPMRDGEPPRSDGGLCLLRSLKSNRSFHRPTHIIGLTAFDELHAKHQATFQEEAWVLLPYEDNSNAWETSLRHKLTHILETKHEESSRMTSRQRPWMSGSFYLVAFVVIAVTFAVVARAVPWYALPLVVVATLLIVPAIGFLQLRHDGQLCDVSFLGLYKAYFSRLRLFGTLLKSSDSSKGDDGP